MELRTQHLEKNNTLNFPVSHSYQYTKSCFRLGELSSITSKELFGFFQNSFSFSSYSVMSEGVAFLCVHLYKGQLEVLFFFAKVMLRT